MTILLPDKVKKILRTLHEAGYEAYAVGGCVRDSLLGREPADWDITTSALPQEVKRLFSRTIDTGLQHGTVTVMLSGEGFEVTTYRLDGEYEDGRHPSSVTFTRSLREDLKRRDFTINAMACDENTLVDYFGGREDLEKGIIRAVGDPRRRFSEDALRIMRAVRFAAQLGYSIEPETLLAASELAQNLRRISAERIMTELNKLLLSDNPGMLKIAYEAGMTAQFLPEFDTCMKTPQNNPHHCYDVGEHILYSLEAVRRDKVLRLAMLLHDVGKPACRTTDADGVDHFHGHPQTGAEMADEILRRLKYDNDTRKTVVALVRSHDIHFGDTEKTFRKVVGKVGKELFPLIMEVKKADICAQSDYQREEKLQKLAVWKEMFRRLEEKNDCVSQKDLAVSGKDLIQMGMPQGPGIGKVLARMLDDVIDTPEHNNREYLLETYRSGGFS